MKVRPEVHPLAKGAPRAAAPDWLAGCRVGDGAAIAAMFAENAPVVERVIYRLVGSTPDLEDLVQSTFVEALRTLPRYRGEASFKTWLGSIAVHMAQHHLRAGRIRRHEPLELVADERLAAPATDAEGQLDERRLSHKLHALLDRLPAVQRIALVLFTLEGLAVEEVAALMSTSQTTTRSRVFFARRALRKLIRADRELNAWTATLLGESAGGVP